MTCLFRWQGQTIPVGAQKFAAVGTTGFGDIGSAYSNSVQGITTAVPRLDVENGTIGTRDAKCLRAYDSVVGSDSFYWAIKPTPTPWSASPTITGPWSMRLYIKAPTPSSSLNFLVFRESGVQNIGFTRQVSTDRITRVASGSAVTLTSPSLTHRIEIQADPGRTNNLVWRVYLEDGTVPLNGFAEAITDVNWDEVFIGYITAGFFSAQFSFMDIEIHDDYDLGGQFRSSPASPANASTTATGAPSWAEGVNARYRPDSTFKTVAAGTPTPTSYLDVNYTTAGTFNRKLDLYLPEGSPPAGGWPVLCWAHSGFFAYGSKSDLPVNWRNDMLLAGYAVASIQYVKTDEDAAAPYTTYGTGNEGGRYPSFIIDYKRAAAFLRDKATTASGGDNTYQINGAKMFATGYSAGGYIALAAAMTRGLSVDSGSLPMTIDGARAAGDAWGDGYTGADPAFIGAYVYAAPVDMDLANAWDPTHPNSGSIIKRFAYRWFQGLHADGSLSAPAYPQQSIASHIGLNSLGNLCPVAYEIGTADMLIHAEHEAALSAALASKGAPYTKITTPKMHDQANELYAREDILNWLNSIAYPSDGIETRSLYLHDGGSSVMVSEDYYDGSVISKHLYSR